MKYFRNSKGKFKILQNMKTILFAVIFLPSLLFSELNAQTKGSISGKVTDKSTGEVLIGANVVVMNTLTGASTDIDGYYSIENLQPGVYKLKFSFISYQTLIVDNVEVKTNEVAHLDVALNPSTTELSEVVVSAEALKSTEAGVLNVQKNSMNIVDGMSAELISKNNSSNGTDVLKRITGINISEGKYAFIRGIGDRYNSTLLNGSTIPSTDPEKKSFSYDLIPASLIENVVTAKTFTPDEPADFAGGLVQINTVEFPSEFIFDLSTSTVFNSNTTGKNFFSYNGGQKDYLGYDDGTRNMPETITSTRIARGNYSDNELTEITKSFSNNWQTYSLSAPLNGSFKFNIGNRLSIGNSMLGYIGSLTYSNGADTKNLTRNFYDFSGARYNYTGNSYTRSVDWGGLLNLSYKFARTNKISFKNVYNQSSDDITTLYNGDYRYTDQYREITSLSFVSRSLLSNQLIGEHQFNIFNGLSFDWNLSYSRSKRDEPDGRRYIYARTIGDLTEPLRFQLDQSWVTRYYGKLTDHNYNGSADFTFKIFENSELPKLKVGYFYDKKDRSFDARSFGFRNVPGGNFAHEDSVLQSSVNQIFLPQNINNKFIQVVELTKPSDSYTSKQIINAGYFMFDATLLEKFRIVAGARLESSRQKLNSLNLQGDTIRVNNNYDDLLPALNLTYLLNDWIYLRAAYSITLARPEFREMAPFTYFDYVANELIEGNPDLKRTLINNYDLRIELYPGAGELIALSFFYKKFKAPIEEILQAAANEPIRSFENADNATNYGIEIELRKNFGFISQSLKNFSIIGNASLINSNVKLNNNGFQESERALQGQAPYIFNAGLYYDNYDAGIDASIVYNKVGERIAVVGSKELGNILEKPVDLVDISVSKEILSYFTIKFSVKDLLNQNRIRIQRSPLGDKTSGTENSGRNISLGLSYKF